jgi:glycosyltransferase involved in cell wall biosynthesis
MQIGVDAVCWANTRGYGRFTRELVRAMAAAAPDDTFVCFLDARAAGAFDLHAPNVRRVVVALAHSPTTAASADGNRTPLDMWRLTRAVASERLDAFFSPSVYTYFPLPRSLPAVVTIHDAIADLYPALTTPSLKARLFWRLKIRAALWQAGLVLTVSDWAGAQIALAWSIPVQRIRVAVEAPAATYTPSGSAEAIAERAMRVGVPSGARWFMYVGGFNPHKNVDVIVRAHAAVVRACGSNPPYLVLVGAISGDVFHGDRSVICRAIADAGTDSLVKWAGFVPDEDLRHLHSGAIALLLPSVCEGFGLPAVEAAACGAPVVATTASPLPQLIEGGGIFVAPNDEPALTRAMRALMDDEPMRARMGTTACRRARALSWDRAARSALGALREVAVAT